MSGWAGNDLIEGDGGADYIDIEEGTAHGGAGDDIIHIEGTGATATGGIGNDTIFVNEAQQGIVYGGGDDDTILLRQVRGGTIYGGGGDDVVHVNGHSGATLRINGDGPNSPGAASQPAHPMWIL